MDNETRYWIDTDPGVDDALAIIYAVVDLKDRLVGLSTVQGNVPERQAAWNLARLLKQLRNGVSSPTWAPTVSRGSRTALTRDGYRPDDYATDGYHGRDGLGGVGWTAEGNWEGNRAAVAAQAIVETARRFPKLGLVCLGPLTNIALALRLDPDLPKSIGSVIIMGGSLRAGGNETMAAEFNFAADAESAQLVLQAGFVDVKLIPIDPCEDVRLGPRERTIIRECKSPAAALVNELLDGLDHLLVKEQGVALYDLVAWILASRPHLANWESVYVAVDTNNGIAHGASIADWRRRSGQTPNLCAAIGVPDHGKFFRELCGLLA